MQKKMWISLVVLVLFLASCNLPAGGGGVVVETPAGVDSGIDVVGTSVELTASARLTEIAGSLTPLLVDTATATAPIPPALTPTQCAPQVTATINANVRGGPDTAYDIVGYLALGATANVAGRNNANTWWYIEYPGASGGHAWIAGSVTTASCLPASLQVVAAPPLPTLPPPTNTKPPEITLAPPVAGVPDLVASGMQYWPEPAKNAQPVSIQVKVTNNGSAPAGSFSVAWLSNQSLPGCSWTVSGLGVGEARNLECEFTYNGSATATYWTTLVVDTGGQVAESNEGNNELDRDLKVKP